MMAMKYGEAAHVMREWFQATGAVPAETLQAAVSKAIEALDHLTPLDDADPGRSVTIVKLPIPKGQPRAFIDPLDAPDEAEN